MAYANQLAERMMRHNGFWTLGFKPQLVQMHPSSVLKTDEEGMLPNYVVYHELISTSRPFLRDLCTVERQWVMPILKKLEKLNINKLSGGSVRSEEQTKGENPSLPEKEVGVARPPDDYESRIQAARDRFLSRKTKSSVNLKAGPAACSDIERKAMDMTISHSTQTSSFPCQPAQATRSAPVVVSGAPTGLASFQSMVIGFVGVCILFFVTFNEFI
ncbi:probable pre-mRNA-splicing factor ATP-dependent RNA helicase DEAH4 [Rhododendron vialii]|uniref:probable pre-mRNA-splicing factor ATP-dependent RNA helicase DEAH4 n=1 Tax=Rhododendron vialii TaxID=182163 RepID=UPI00265F2465|nr:probable pre-mRNA-splicing factor ATP-dependent RNA helicase DEAH4 [Rhododendron vialii]